MPLNQIIYQYEITVFFSFYYAFMMSFNCSPPTLLLCLFLSLLLADCSPPVPFLCFFLSLLLATSIHRFARFCSELKILNAPPLNASFIPIPGGPKFAYEARHGPANCTPNDALASVFSVLPVLNTQDTFAPFLNFKVSHFARHFLFLSFGVAMKGIQFTQLRCHISSLVHSVHHLFLFHPAVYDCWIHVNDSTPATRGLFERWIPVGSSETAVCGFCLSVSLHFNNPHNNIVNCYFLTINQSVHEKNCKKNVQKNYVKNKFLFIFADWHEIYFRSAWNRRLVNIHFFVKLTSHSFNIGS